MNESAGPKIGAAMTASPLRAFATSACFSNINLLGVANVQKFQGKRCFVV